MQYGIAMINSDNSTDTDGRIVRGGQKPERRSSSDRDVGRQGQPGATTADGQSAVQSAGAENGKPSNGNRQKTADQNSQKGRLAQALRANLRRRKEQVRKIQTRDDQAR